MNPKYLLDTNIVSEPLKPNPDPGLLKRLKRYQDRLAIASTVWHELCYGALRLARGRRRRMLVEYLENAVRASMPIIPYDELAAAVHADHRAKLASAGKPPSFADGQIAATAIANDMVLVTSNVSHFEVFEELAVEDWKDTPSSKAKQRTR